MESATKEKQGLTITVKNPAVLIRMVDRLEEASREMQSINPNFTPIKGNTKDRWQKVMDDAADMFNRLAGRHAVHAGQEA